jgi:hypothetical protein
MGAALRWSESVRERLRALAGLKFVAQVGGDSVKYPAPLAGDFLSV